MSFSAAALGKSASAGDPRVWVVVLGRQGCYLGQSSPSLLTLAAYTNSACNMRHCLQPIFRPNIFCGMRESLYYQAKILNAWGNQVKLNFESLHMSHLTWEGTWKKSLLVLWLNKAWVRSHLWWPSVAVCQLGLPREKTWITPHPRLFQFPTCWKIPRNIYWVTTKEQ